MHFRPEVAHLLQPLVVSWGWEPDVPGPEPIQWMFEWMGTHNPASYLTVPTAIEWQAARDWPAVRRACHELLRDTERRICEMYGLAPISPDDMWVQMRTIPLPPCDLAELKTRLWDDYQIEVPLVGWNGGHYIRVSIQCYNSQADADRLVGALKKLV